MLARYIMATLDAARQRYLDAAREFHTVTRDVPSGLPHPDGSIRVQRQADIMRRTFDEYQQVRKDLEDVLAEGDTRTHR